jgi:two-component system chemotaxis response regulator CheY
MPSPSPEDRQPTVLLVEDNESTRLGMAEVLALQGYLVLNAANGHDAIAVLQSTEGQIDVVLLDVHLPDVSGVDLYARLREVAPGLPVVVCSGEAEPAEVARLLELGMRRYFQKPITSDELRAAVEAALH